MTRGRLAKAGATAVAWLGLVLMVASFIVLLRQSDAPWPVTDRRSPPAPSFRLVVIDPGHGGKDSGAQIGAMAEKDLTLDVALRLERLLAGRGFATELTRSQDVYVSLADRAGLSNRAADAILVSIHFNDGAGAPASGVETYFAARQTTAALNIATWLPFLRSAAPNLDSQSLAGFIQQELVARTHAADRGTKPEQFYVLANVRHPAALVEAGFLTNRSDATRLNDAGYREQLASAIATGIMKFQSALRQRNTRADPEYWQTARRQYFPLR